MMYYAIRLMIIALIAFAMGRVTTSEASMLCQGHCLQTKKASVVTPSKFKKTDCHQSKSKDTSQKKNNNQCNHMCCMTLVTHYFAMSSITLTGALFVKTLENYPCKTVEISTYQNNPLRPPIA